MRRFGRYLVELRGSTAEVHLPRMDRSQDWARDPWVDGVEMMMLESQYVGWEEDRLHTCTQQP